MSGGIDIILKINPHDGLKQVGPIIELGLQGDISPGKSSPQLAGGRKLRGHRRAASINVHKCADKLPSELQGREGFLVGARTAGAIPRKITRGRAGAGRGNPGAQDDKILVRTPVKIEDID